MSSSVRWPTPTAGAGGQGKALIVTPPPKSSGTEDFAEYTNGTSLAYPWMAWTTTAPTILSGKAYDSSPLGDTTWAAATDSADSYMEILFETAMTSGNGENFGVGIRLTDHSSAANGYMFEINETGGGGYTPKLYRGSAFTAIATGSTISSSASIDGIRITAVGTTITGYCRISGVWTSAVSTTDANYTAAGYPGFWVQDPSPGADMGVTEASWGTPAAGTDATVTAVISDIAVAAPLGALAAGSDVTAAVSDVAVSAPPANNMISSVVNAPAVVVLVSAPAAALGSTADATVTAPPATVNVDAPVGDLSAGVDVAAAVSDVAVTGPVGALAAGADVTASVSDVVVQAPRPTISPAPAGGNATTSITTTFAEDAA